MPADAVPAAAHRFTAIAAAPREVAPAPPVAARIAAPAPAAGGGSGSAVAGAAAGGGGGRGTGAGDGGGADLVQIAGAILPSDYPANLREHGAGGRVGILFAVGENGRVSRCSVTRSSGIAELDTLTCRLIRERFVYRPSTDASGHPIADEVEGEHDWIAARR